MMILLAPLKYY